VTIARFEYPQKSRHIMFRESGICDDYHGPDASRLSPFDPE